MAAENYDTWGTSWLASWGNSWGRRATAGRTPLFGPGRRKVKPDKRRDVSIAVALLVIGGRR